MLGDDLYAALLLVVLVTTLITPPLLKLRYGRVSAAVVPTGPPADTPAPDGGWLRVEDGEIGLAADPPLGRGLVLGLRAAVLAGRHRPTQELLTWLSVIPADAMVWDDEAREALLDVVERGNARSWRFLLTAGVLGGALPEIERAMRDREADQVFVDASAAFRLRSIERLRTLDADDPLALEAGRLDDVDAMLVALLALEATDGAGNRAEVAEADRDPHRLRRLAALGASRHWPRTATSYSGRPPTGRPRSTEPAVLPLATHVETPERARATYVITALRQADQERWELDRLRQLHDLVQAVLADTGLTGTDVRSLVTRRRREAVAVVDADADLMARIEAAPRSFVIRVTPEELAACARLVAPVPRPDEARVAVLDADLDRWTVLVGARDRQGLLAMVSGVLAAGAYDVRRAVVATWLDGVAVEAFEVRGTVAPVAEHLAAEVRKAFDEPLAADPLPSATVHFDDASSPWHTICEVEALDQPGLLHQLATAFTAAQVDVVAASIAESGDDAVDTFELVQRDGDKLNESDHDAVRAHIRDGVSLSRRRFRSGLVAR